MTESPEQRLHELLYHGDQAAWTTAALVLSLRDRAATPLADAARQVTTALDLDLPAALAGRDPAAAAAQAAAPLLQAAAAVRGDAVLWAQQPDEALLAQGLASARNGARFVEFAATAMPGLLAALDRPGARVLDVGTGVGALAVAVAEALPRVTVVGIDVLPRVLALAERVRAASPAADRVVLRQQDVATLGEEDAYDLGWVPAPFVPEPALRPGLRAVTRALRPGGYLVLGHGKYVGDPVDDALNRFRTLAYGGTALDDASAQQALVDAGLDAVTTTPTPLGSPAITVGRKPT
ncbi:SAM-dependent methyltransferase [Geodermatophilus sp. SYSU D00710]